MLRSIVKKVSFATQEASNARLLVYSCVECNLHVTILKVSVASSSLNFFFYFLYMKSALNTTLSLAQSVSTWHKSTAKQELC